MLAVSTEFPAFVSADSVLTVSRAMTLGPDVVVIASYFVVRMMHNPYGILPPQEKCKHVKEDPP